MIDGPAGSGPRGRVAVGAAGIPNSLAALRRAAYQASNREASLNIVYVIPAGAHEAAEASSYRRPGIARCHVTAEGPGRPADSSADPQTRAAAAQPATRVLRATGSDVR